MAVAVQSLTTGVLTLSVACDYGFSYKNQPPAGTMALAPFPLLSGELALRSPEVLLKTSLPTGTMAIARFPVNLLTAAMKTELSTERGNSRLHEKHQLATISFLAPTYRKHTIVP